jgi:hypothetical protein
MSSWLGCVVNVLWGLDFIMAPGGELSSTIGFDCFSHSESDSSVINLIVELRWTSMPSSGWLIYTEALRLDSSVTNLIVELWWTSMPSGGWLTYTEASRLADLNFSSSWEFVLTAFGNCLYPLPSSVLI